jgi:hypothetical protein
MAIEDDFIIIQRVISHQRLLYNSSSRSWYATEYYFERYAIDYDVCKKNQSHENMMCPVAIDSIADYCFDQKHVTNLKLHNPSQRSLRNRFNLSHPYHPSPRWTTFQFSKTANLTGHQRHESQLIGGQNHASTRTGKSIVDAYEDFVFCATYFFVWRATTTHAANQKMTQGMLISKTERIHEIIDARRSVWYSVCCRI